MAALPAAEGGGRGNFVMLDVGAWRCNVLAEWYHVPARLTLVFIAIVPTVSFGFRLAHEPSEG